MNLLVQKILTLLSLVFLLATQEMKLMSMRLLTQEM